MLHKKYDLLMKIVELVKLYTIKPHCEGINKL